MHDSVALLQFGTTTIGNVVRLYAALSSTNADTTA
jgi:hypothetical protein